jgi:hypothetical protein
MLVGIQKLLGAAFEDFLHLLRENIDKLPVGHFGTSIGEPLALPLGSLPDELLPGENSRLGECTRGQQQGRKGTSATGLIHGDHTFTNHGVPGTCALRAPSSFISAPRPRLSVGEMRPFSMISPCLTQLRHRSGESIQCYSCTRKLGIAAHTLGFIAYRTTTVLTFTNSRIPQTASSRP